MNFLKQFFGKAVQEAQEFDAVMASCQFESNNNDCSLVQQLKQKQAEKRELDAKIRDFNDDGISNIPHFVELVS